MDMAEVVRASGVSAGALRHYEAEGLLDARHVGRRPNGYRSYSDEGLARVKLIATGRAVGLSLRDIRAGIDAWEDGSTGPEERMEIFEAQVRALDERIESLVAMRNYLVRKVTDVHDGEPPVAP